MTKYLASVAFGIALGLLIGTILGHVREDTCQARVSSQHTSFCLDKPANKLMERFK